MARSIPLGIDATSLPSFTTHTSHTYLDHSIHVTLGSCKLRRVFHFDQNYEVQVMIHVVLASNVLLETDRLVVESRPIQTWNKKKMRDCSVK
jgi:hypothetical protein